ncbi:serine/threonine protein phosphatase 2A 57 kDa regulatory subunit B' alpha isoform-like isoform X1 [Punica granatum]|uniref:Serine/threonine protein phosphatase 2A 57 kDa regulatory subunit B' alpha isoform-like isoform X1 n=1 Tax=Punica granatum TaxID=22663 RepID=A0A6P8DJ02_PUNGR|nr:serine/threonine protein phosphatase 2A 57 kDa regulatory subunit B' alpha isoform-like isoform X1 [Punica granatum]XP_031393327.1 serine/threonine protein phosphatase 2A 57 kDa regulatory subunit B' alpha isoform-like isoform X1 [Punica granatum]
MGAGRFPSPRDSPGKRSTLQHLFDMDSRGSPLRSSGNSSSPLRRHHHQPSANEEILSMISACSVTFTFTDPSESPSQQDLKRLKLTQLLYLIKSSKRPLDDQTDVIPPLVSMLKLNIFRPLPPPSNFSFISDLPDDEELVSTASPLWPHLQIIYDILQRLIMKTNPKTLRDHVDRPFLCSFLCLLQSEDPRERERLKSIYHLIYSKFTSHRSFMRKSMSDVLLRYMYETERHCGIGEILEILGSIINGFTVPLKEEHKLFLIRVLLPLHRAKGTMMYHKQLSYCVSQFVQKEPALGGVVVRGILRYWPITNSQKEVLIIDELEELVEKIDPDQYRKLALPLCTKITRCFNSLNSQPLGTRCWKFSGHLCAHQVAERALYIWNNEQLVKMVSVAMDEVFPVVVEGLEKNLKWHWSPSVRQLTENVKQMFEEMDPALYAMCVQEMERWEAMGRREEARRKERWEMIESLAASRQPNHHQPFFQTPKYICV